MLTTMNDFAEGLRDVCPESILFSAVPKPDVDFVTDLIKQQTDEVPEYLCSVYDWISKSANVEDFFANLFVNMSEEKISKIELLTRGQNDNKLWHNYRKGVNMWSLCQNISRLPFTNPDLPALKYCQTMEMEAANEFLS